MNTVPIEYGEFVEQPVEVPAMRVAGVPQWQSIETAPKDGRTILLGHYNSHGKWRTLRGQWFSAATIAETWEDDECPEGWYETSVECDDDVNAWWTEPTHWKPLDPPPGAAPSPITDAVAPAGMTQAAQDVLAERRRQIEQEGWDAGHDDAHRNGGMAVAAACYAMHSGIDAAIESGDIGAHSHNRAGEFVPRHWPWARIWWKPKDRRSNLIRAGALILAEIERLDRAALSSQEGKLT